MVRQRQAFDRDPIEVVGTTKTRFVEARQVINVRDRQRIHAAGRLQRVARCHHVEMTEAHPASPFVACVVRFDNVVAE